MKGRSLYLLSILIVGVALGTLYAWIISPIRYVETTPGTLRADFKDQFRTAIALAYGATGNLDRARARLVLLGDADSVQELTAQAQRMLAAGQSFELAQQVARLAADLRSGEAGLSITPVGVSAQANPSTAPSAGAGPTAPATPGITEASPTVESLLTPVLVDTPTPRPTRTPIPTPASPFQLIGREEVCNQNLTDGLLQISVLDRAHHPMPGVEIAATWDTGEDHFFTGLKPEISNGYADYVMQAGVTYSLRVPAAGTTVSDVSAPSCPETAGQTYSGGLKLTFQQP